MGQSPCYVADVLAMQSIGQSGNHNYLEVVELTVVV